MRHISTISDEKYELTILMPCLNEIETVGACVGSAKDFLRDHGIPGEVLIADNGSTDGSKEAATRAGARVIAVRRRGYGCALRSGIRASKGNIIIITDCDTTYDFNDIEEIYGAIRSGRYDMVIGNRFTGGIEPGAMPLSHNIGVRALSFLGRKRYGVSIGDFHGGLRGLTREAAGKLDFKTTGMEFATEMIALASKAGLRVGEVPVKLKKCRYHRVSKLRTVRDGLRHLIFIIK